MDAQRQKYIDMIVNDIKLEDSQMEILFGSNLPEFRADPETQKIIANNKLDNELQSHEVKNLKITELLKLQASALETILESLSSGDHTVRLNAAKFILTGSNSYISQKAKNTADAETPVDTSTQSFPPLSYDPRKL